MPVSQKRSRSASSMKTPVGLLGLIIRINFVLSFIALSIASTSYCRSPSRTGIETTFPPHNSARGGNNPKVGFDIIISSPGCIKIRIMQSIISDDPLQSATLSGPRSYILPILVLRFNMLSGYRFPLFTASATAFTTLSEGGIGFSLSISLA